MKPLIANVQSPSLSLVSLEVQSPSFSLLSSDRANLGSSVFRADRIRGAIVRLALTRSGRLISARVLNPSGIEEVLMRSSTCLVPVQARNHPEYVIESRNYYWAPDENSPLK